MKEIDSDKYREILGRRIAEVISASGKTQRKIAEECGVSPQAVIGWKQGKISKEALSKLAASVGVDWADILSVTNESTDIEDYRVKRLLRRFNNLNDAGKDYLLRQAAELSDLMEID